MKLIDLDRRGPLSPGDEFVDTYAGFTVAVTHEEIAAMKYAI